MKKAHRALSSLVISLTGGVGKHICFTSLLPTLSKQYGNIHVLCSYPDVFDNNPFISTINDVERLGGYSFIKRPDVDFIVLDPYDHPKFLKKECHLLDAWHDFIIGGYANSREELKPSLHLTDKNLYNIDAVLSSLMEETKGKYILFQLHGGQSPFNFDESPDSSYAYYEEEMKRFYPFDYYNNLIHSLKNAYPNHALIRYSLPNEYIPSASKPYIFNLPPLPFKEYKVICEEADAIVAIDSSLQHIAATVNLKRPAVVIWGETAPEHQGYPFHFNLREDQPKDTQTYCRPFGSPNDNVVFPHPDKVMQALQDVGMVPEEPEMKEEISDSHDCNDCQCNAG